MLEYFIPILSTFNYVDEQNEIIGRVFESAENTLILRLFTSSHASNRTLSLSKVNNSKLSFYKLQLHASRFKL